MNKAIKIVATVVVILLCGMFIFGCCMASDRSVYSVPYATDALKDAYSDGESVIYKHLQTTEISPDGYFSAYSLYYNPESGEAQVAVRWNDSIHRYTDTEPGTEFGFILVNNTTGEEYPCTIIESSEKSIYNYRHYACTADFSSEDQISAALMITDDYRSEMIVKYPGQAFTEYKLPKKLVNDLYVR